MNIDTIINSSPDSILKGIAVRARDRRLELNLTQKAFTKRAELDTMHSGTLKNRRNHTQKPGIMLVCTEQLRFIQHSLHKNII